MGETREIKLRLIGRGFESHWAHFKMQTLEEWIEDLKNSNKLIVVEGKKDKKTLQNFGIKNIITVSKPLYKIVEDIAKKNKECVLLFDLDKEGKKLYSKIKHQLQKHKVKIDTKFREFLFKNTKLAHIEGLSTYLNKINQRTY